MAERPGPICQETADRVRLRYKYLVIPQYGNVPRVITKQSRETVHTDRELHTKIDFRESGTKKEFKTTKNNIWGST